MCCILSGVASFPGPAQLPSLAVRREAGRGLGTKATLVYVKTGLKFKFGVNPQFFFVERSGGWGHAPQENPDDIRVLLRPSETTIITQNLCKWTYLGDSLYGRFTEHLSFGVSLCI